MNCNFYRFFYKVNTLNMKHYFLIYIILLLTACGGGGGGSGGGSTQPPPPNTGAVISGVAVKGAISGATINAYRISDSDFDTPIASANTTNDGAYSLQLNDNYRGLVIVRAIGGQYQDETSGIIINNSQLTAVVNVKQDRQTTAIITPFTELAYRYMQSTNINIATATDFVARQFGIVDNNGMAIDIVTTTPSIYGIDDIGDNDAGRYGFALAVAFSQALATATVAELTKTLANYALDLANGGMFDSITTLTKAVLELSTNTITVPTEVIRSILRPTPNIVLSGLKDFRQFQVIDEVNFASDNTVVATWSISPDLPSGLRFEVSSNNITATILGTPTTLGISTHTIVATNINGSDSLEITIRVEGNAPNLRSNLAPQTYIERQTITPLMVRNTGGDASNWNANLPAGLVYATTTQMMMITGAPVAALSPITYTIVAENSVGRAVAKLPIKVLPRPPNIVDIGRRTYIKGVAITPFIPTNTGGAINVWSSAITQNTGLNFNTQTGEISGTPTMSADLASYTIVVENKAGNHSAIIQIVVLEPTPILTTQTPQNFVLNQRINPAIQIENIGGKPSLWSITPTLPNGLIFNNFVGIIFGTPTTLSPPTEYMITASNCVIFNPLALSCSVADIVNSTTTIIIAVSQNAPNINNQVALMYQISTTINPIKFTNTGGGANFWSITPTLPLGLSFVSGTISGTPQELNPLTRYTITASNTSGVDSAIVDIAVNDRPPILASIANQNYQQGVMISPLSISNSGGSVIGWRINPDLPAGLSFNNGVISGTPTISSTMTTYTISATNSGGADNTSVNIAVNTSFNNIAGTLNVVPNVIIDSDTNDINAAIFRSNNNPSSAQRISNGVTVYGFVTTVPMSTYGIGGNFGSIVDNNDWYLVTLLENQVVNLDVSDHSNIYGYDGDIDVFLFERLSRSMFRLVGVSIFSSEFERVVAPRNGEYLIWVRAYSSAVLNIESTSKYTLSLANLNTNHQLQGQNMDFIEHQSVVRYKNDDKLNFKLEQISIPQISNPFADGILRQTEQSFAKYTTLLSIKEKSLQAEVDYAEPNYIYRPLFIPNDPHYNLQWHYNNINLPAAWDITRGSSEVIVAVIDNGVYLGHSDLKNQLIDGYDFIANANNADDGDGIDNNPDDPGDINFIQRSSWHGTHVAGTIGAETNNNIGVAGVAHNIKIMPIRALGTNGVGNSYDVAQSVLYAAGLANDSGTVPAQKADIINLSLGGGGSSLFTEDIYRRAYEAGVIIIAAAGNNNNNRPFYPAAYDNVVAVSAVDYLGNKARYSNFGSAIDVAAPGGNRSADLNNDGHGDGVFSTAANISDGARADGYRFYNGTSMAAPHVAGIAALMKSIYPAMTPQIFDNLLASGEITDDAGEPDKDDIYGYGIINALKAVREAQNLQLGGDIPLSPINIAVVPNPVNLGLATNITVNISNLGTTPASITNITSSDNWLRIDPINTTETLGDYRINIDRNNLSEGIYNGNITLAISNGDNISISVSMQVGIIASSRHNIDVVLIDSSNTVVATTTANAVGNDNYQYSFDRIRNGQYLVFASSDIDSDNELSNSAVCQLGEICGAYPVLNRPELVVLNNADQRDINFNINIIFNTNSNSARE